MSEKYIIPTPGDVIAGKYHIEEELGRGAYGVVFRARQEGIGRHVALKTLLPKAFLESDIVERFEREAQFVGRLNHPNVVGVHDYGRHENLLYMAVEYVEGETLDDIIGRDGPLEPERVRKIVYQMVEALEHAHETGIVHRDLKPANIVILERPAGEAGKVVEVVKVLDFGIAKLIQSETEGEAPETLTQAGTVLGTPHYMSPETIIGERVDHRADVYSLGVMIYEMLTGERPFGAKNSPGVMVKHLRDEPPELPAHLEQSCWGEAVRRCMAKRPEERLRSADEVRRILERRDEGVVQPAAQRASVPGSATMKAAALSSDESGERMLVPAVVIGALVAVGIAVGFGWISAEGEAEEAAVVVEEVDESERAASAPEADQTEERGEAVRVMDFAGGEADAGVKAGAPVEVADRANTVGAPVTDDEHDEDERVEREPVAEREAVAEKKPAIEKTARKQPAKKRPAAKKTAEAEPVAEKVTLRIRTTPANARVTVAGTPVGAAPVEHILPAGDEPVSVELHHIGYRTMRHSVVPDRDQTVELRMEKGRLELIP